MKLQSKHTDSSTAKRATGSLMPKLLFPWLPNYPGLLAELADAYLILPPLLPSLSALLTTPIASLKNPVHFPITFLKTLSHVLPSSPSLSFLFSCTPIYIKYTAKSQSLDFLYTDIPT